MNPDAPAGDDESTDTPRQGAWCTSRLVLATVARAALGTVVGLLMWAQLPALALGWPAAVVMSGSMRPALTPGDVVLYQPLHGRAPTVGQIVLAPDPTQPDRLLTHRVYQVRANGDVITKGDANPTPDSTALRPSAIQGLARWRVPWVGLPVRLWRIGKPLTAAITTLGLLALLCLAASAHATCPHERSRSSGKQPASNTNSRHPVRLACY